jgi:hypothetical protein
MSRINQSGIPGDRAGPQISLALERNDEIDWHGREATIAPSSFLKKLDYCKV